MAVHLAVAGDVFDGVLFCAVYEMSRMRSGTEKSQFLSIFLPFLRCILDNKSSIFVKKDVSEVCVFFF